MEQNHLAQDMDFAQGQFTRIHNELLETLALARLTGSEYRCLIFLLRKTYGWHKQEERISLGEWARGTGMGPKQRHNVLRTLRGLVAKQVIYAKANGSNRPLTWGLNKVVAWDNSLFLQCHSGLKGVDNESHTGYIRHRGATRVRDRNSVAVRSDEYTAVVTRDNTSVLTGDNTTVLTHDNSCVITGEYANNKRNRKERSKESVKEQGAKHPALQEQARTPQQAMFGAICEALGWDTRTITEGDKLRVAQGAKILTKADYAASDIQRFMVEVWFRDWRWQKYQQRPTLTQLRQEIGKVRLEPNDSEKYAREGALWQPRDATDGAGEPNDERRGGEYGKDKRDGFNGSAIGADLAHRTAMRADFARRHGLEYDVEIQRQFDEHRARRIAEGSLYYK